MTSTGHTEGVRLRTGHLTLLVLLLSVHALAGPCVTGTLQDYINLGAGGCQWNGATYSDFATVSGQNFATPISPLLVGVTPGSAAPLSRLTFTLNANALTGEFFESIFRFHVAAPNLDAASLLLGDQSSATGDGAATATTNVCPNGSYPGDSPTLCPNTEEQMIVTAIEGFSFPIDSRSFVAASFFDVFFDITIDGGLSGTAHLDWAALEVTTRETIEIPEPSTALLMLCGAALLIWRGRAH